MGKLEIKKLIHQEKGPACKSLEGVTVSKVLHPSYHIRLFIIIVLLSTKMIGGKDMSMMFALYCLGRIWIPS